jgi:hypothetical protein
MESRQLGARDGEAVRQAIALGAIAQIETARAECTEAFLRCAIERGLWQTWAQTLPAPRGEPAPGMEVRLPAPLAARFAGRYSRRPAGSVLRSARVLGAGGARGEGRAPAPGLSGRGTSEEKLCSGDVVRTRLGQLEPPAALRQPVRRPPPELGGAVTVRPRASRRAGQQAVDAAEAAARARQGAAPLVGWYHPHVGGALWHDARVGRGRRLHRLDTTPRAGPCEGGTEEGSGAGQNEEGPAARGSQLAPWRTWLARAGRFRQVARAARQGHAGALGRPWLEQAAG